MLRHDGSWYLENEPLVAGERVEVYFVGQGWETIVLTDDDLAVAAPPGSPTRAAPGFRGLVSQLRSSQIRRPAR